MLTWIKIRKTCGARKEREKENIEGGGGEIGRDQKMQDLVGYFQGFVFVLRHGKGPDNVHAFPFPFPPCCRPPAGGLLTMGMDLLPEVHRRETFITTLSWLHKSPEGD